MIPLDCNLVLGYLTKKRQAVRAKIATLTGVYTSEPNYIRLSTEERILSDLIEETMHYMSVKGEVKDGGKES